MNNPETSNISPDKKALTRNDIYDLVLAISDSFRRIDEGAESDDEIKRQKSIMANADISCLSLAMLYSFNKDFEINSELQGEAIPTTTNLLRQLSSASREIALKNDTYEELTALKDELAYNLPSNSKEIIEKCAIRSTIQPGYEKAEELFEQYKLQADSSLDLLLLIIVQNENLKTNSMFERLLPKFLEIIDEYNN